MDFKIGYPSAVTKYNLDLTRVNDSPYGQFHPTAKPARWLCFVIQPILGQVVNLNMLSINPDLNHCSRR